MIVSHRHRFIFIKTHKTAGTSMEVALARFLGPDDIMAPDWPWDEHGRRGPGDIPPQNHLLPWLEHGPVTASLVTLRAMRTGAVRRRYKFWNHMPAAAVRRRIGPRLWQRYTKFTIERNPWDKVVSRYYWDERKRPSPRSFEKFVRTGRSKRRNADFDLYALRGQIAVDHVLFYERLTDDARWLGEKLALPEALDLRRDRVNAKSQHRPERDYRAYYTQALRDKVAQQFGREIASFGYQF
jgi:hypothetical protein